MIGPAPGSGRPQQAMPWLRHLAAAMVDCALQPLLDGAQAEALLSSRTLMDDPGPEGAAARLQDGSAYRLRSVLIETAAWLLDRPDAEADGRRLRRAMRALAVASELFDFTGAERSRLNWARMRYALAPTAWDPPDRLAADMRHYRDEHLERLADTHLLLRLAAVAWRLASDDELVLGPVAGLLEADESGLAALVRRAKDADRLPGEPRSEAALRRSIDRFRNLEAVLQPLADAGTPALAMAMLEQLLPSWLGRPVMPLWLTADARLTVHGSSDLAGQSLRLHGSRSVAATAATRGEVTVQSLTGPGTSSIGFFPPGAMALGAAVEVSVFDRQCAERLEAAALLALPVGAPETLAVLLLNADVDALDLSLVGIHVARWLTRVAAFEQQGHDAAAAQQDRFMRRLREAIHEISNPLSVMQNYLHLLGTRLEEDESAQEQVRLIGDELRRASALLRGLADAERMDTPAAAGKEVTDVNALLSDVLALVEGSLDSGVPTEVRFTPGQDLPALGADAGRLRQVLLNLTRNALEAMPDGGILDVVVDQAVTDGGRRGIEIQVSDTGVGIDAALLGQIFESGVSVKGPGRGLGLAITRRLVHELGGEISCRSRLGAGTSFVVWLPVG